MEFMKCIINNIIPEFAGTIVEHVGYPFQVDNKIRDLEKVTRDLMAMKEDVKTIIESAERENCAPTKQVLEWLRKIEAFEKEAEEIQENNNKRRRSVWSDYKTSKSATKKLCEVKSLFDQKATIEVTMHLPPSFSKEMPASPSKSSILKSALQSIKTGVRGVIGIWGMGGVELCRVVAFNVVVFVTCSKECHEEKVQDEIIGKLGLNKPKSIEQKQCIIFNYLKQKSFVLLLDDLWNHVDLEKIGIPSPTSTNGTTRRKVVLITRSENVCRLMEANNRMRVNVLDWNAAWNLFKRKANKKNIESNTLVQKYAAEVVEKLGRLPLALITVGRALSDTTDPRDWKHAVELLKHARLHEVEHVELDETVFKLLKFSYDKLRNDNLRECFLHCALWPEDYEIEKSALVELWMGLDLIDEDDIHMAYNVGYSYIRELQVVYLLEATNNESYIKLHDVIRDMSLWIVSKQGIEKNKWIVISNATANDSNEIIIKEKTKKISVMNQRVIYFSNNDCDAEITTLLINCPNYPQMSHKLRGIFRPFFIDRDRHDVPKELKDHSFSKLTVLNMENNRLNSVPILICNIISLRFIDLSASDIESLSTELGALNNLKYLILRRNKIFTVPIGTISKMRALLVMDLTPGYEGKRLEGELAFVPLLLNELQSLPAFSALGMEIDNVVHFHKPSVLSNVPVRWLTVSSKKKLSTFSFSPCFHGTSQSRRNVVYISIKHIVLKSLIFECTCENSSCQLDVLEELEIYDITAK